MPTIKSRKEREKYEKCVLPIYDQKGQHIRWEIENRKDACGDFF